MAISVRCHYVEPLYCLPICSIFNGAVTSCRMEYTDRSQADRRFAEESYPMVKAVSTAAPFSRDLCLGRIKHTITINVQKNYRSVADISVRVTPGKAPGKRKCQS